MKVKSTSPSDQLAQLQLVPRFHDLLASVNDEEFLEIFHDFLVQADDSDHGVVRSNVCLIDPSGSTNKNAATRALSVRLGFLICLLS